ncbi:hypothetical protein HELRODRAFT_68925 [Helobdella robusta]|uniref:26S proteasome non-ATPase regulatory subunit 9 n=1 Tax=Helobdella robusta TaxID=6412 RepID=T1FZL8_HELRO|nr:hypothetical protein HELRODRAFT_68925 [Helobdella robusta]ESN94209.1 hypothetical protein HELRODRAFT_68925 [Helobdella robusta]
MNLFKHLYFKQQKDIGMTESLVDNEQFPRNDIDIITVRNARQKIICLQNDHKAIMKEIETQLHKLHHQSTKTSHSIVTDLKQLGVVDDEKNKNCSTPFASVGKVEAGSPADVAGLKSGDLLLQFGSLNVKNFRNLQDFAKIVQHNKGQSLHFVVSRNYQPLRLCVKPSEWHGPGLLGCNILPLKN